MMYFVKPIVCDYGVYEEGKDEPVCICNLKSNADLIVDILKADSGQECAYGYDVYPDAKYECKKKEEPVWKQPGWNLKKWMDYEKKKGEQI